MKSFAVIFLASLLIFQTAGAIDEHELPFGFYTPQLPIDADMRKSLRDDLGANMVTLGFSSNEEAVADLSADGIKSIPNLAYVSKLGRLYESACYSVWQAEDEQSEIRFKIRSGEAQVVDGNTWWVAPSWEDDSITDSVFLDNLWYRQVNVKDQSGSFLPFEPTLRIRTDVDNSLAGDTLGYLRVYEVRKWWQEKNPQAMHEYLIATYPIEADLFLADSSSNMIDYAFPGYLKQNKGSVVNYQISTTGICSLMVDYLKISNLYGRKLIDNHENNAEIICAVTKAWDDTSNIFAWELRDEPLTDLFMPWHYVDSLIQRVTLDEFGISLHGMSAYNWDLNNSRGRAFLQIARPTIWSPDVYCFYGSCYSQKTLYSGATESGNERGLQVTLDEAFVSLVDNTRYLADSSGTEWVLIPQLFLGRDDVCDGVTWRWPTPSELSCETFIGLCYQPSGILYFKHGSSWRFNDAQDGFIGHTGFYDTTSAAALKTGLFSIMKDDINPYIKAIDSTYLELTWERAYSFAEKATFLQPPPGAFVDTIYSSTNGTEPNPDAGWFQVGEFSRDSDKFVMLVNRACSQGENNPAPAPSVTATVEFDSENLGLGDFVYIIDIATGTKADDWVGVPDTTYSAKMPDGTIPLTTVLGPGEGRLFKITAAAKR